MLSLSPDQILSLAPDDASKKAGQGLANGAKWANTGSSERSLWGECQGSGSKPYQTVVETATLTSKCSCPSRKFPCKHGLGMLLLHAKDAARFTTLPEPDWASEWLAKREQKAATPAESKKGASDEKAQQKRQAAREEKAAAGLDELLLWLKDLVRTGLVQLPEKGHRFFEAMSRRMVDAQLPGLARAVTGIGETNFYAENWHSEVLDAVARLYLTISGYQHLTESAPLLLQDVRTTMGLPQGADPAGETTVPQTTWMVLGKAQTQEGALRVEQFWLGDPSGNTALFLQFGAPGTLPVIQLVPGDCFQGEVQFFPAAHPFRVQLKQVQRLPEAVAISALANWDAVADRESQVLAQAPLLTDQPFVVEALKPVVDAQQRWTLEDREGRSMQLSDPQLTDRWKWLAISGGAYLKTAVLGSENRYRPLGVWHGTTFTPID